MVARILVQFLKSPEQVLNPPCWVVGRLFNSIEQLVESSPVAWRKAIDVSMARFFLDLIKVAFQP